MARSDNIANFCIDVANAIRNKLEITDEIPASEFDTKIREINTGTGINGKIAEYIAGGEIQKGEFVKLIDNEVIKVTSKSETISGIAKMSVKEGQTVEIVVPNVPIVEPIIELVLNTGESDNYGFSLGNDGYYVSGNTGLKSTYSKCRICIKTKIPITLTIVGNSYSELNYDYGLIGDLDTELTADNIGDSTYKAKVTSSSDIDYTTAIFNIEGDNVEHFIDLKYRKNSSSNANNDNFKFKYNYDFN